MAPSDATDTSADDGVYHRFPADFWERAGYLRDALPDNRLGRLSEGQEIFFIGDALRISLYVLFILGAVSVTFAVVAHASRFSAFLLIVTVGLLLALAAAFAVHAIGIVRALNRDRATRQVVSFCGELTSWISPNTEGFTDDRHGLEYESHRVHTSEKAWSALPEKAHYRIYFTPRQRNVVNVEEHSDDAPHAWLRTSS